MSNFFDVKVWVLVFATMVWIITLKKRPFSRIIILTSFSYGLLIAILVRSLFSDILENPTYFPDAYHYISYATQKVSEWRGEGSLGYIPLAVRGYSYFLAALFAIYGENIYAVILAQLLLALLIPILTFSIAKQFVDLKTAKRSALLVAFYPDLYVWAAFVLKEILAVFLICLSLDQFFKLVRSPRVATLVGTVGSLGFLLFVRPHIALFLALMFLVSLLWNIRLKRLKALGLLSVTVTTFAIIMSKAGLSGLITVITETRLPVYNRGEILLMATLPELLKMLLSGEIALNVALGMGRFLLSPLPWQATNAYHALIPGVILWYIVLPLGVLGMVKMLKTHRRSYILVMTVLFVIFWYALTLTATDPRWRLMILPFMLIFASYGFAESVRNMSKMILWLLSVSVIWLFLAIYSFGVKFVMLVVGIALLAGMLAEFVRRLTIRIARDIQQ